MPFEILELLNDEDLNEQEKCKAFRKRITERCSMENKVLDIFRILKSIEMELEASLEDTVQINVDRSTVERLLRIISIELRIIRYKIKHPGLVENPVSGNFPIGEWTGNKADLIELVYAISLVRSVEHGNVSIKAIKEGFEHIFGIDLGNIHERLDDIASRKEPRTRYLEKLVECLNKFLYSQDAK
jgi:hypothetical protein